MALIPDDAAKKTNTIWNIIKTVIEIIIAAIAGGAAATTAKAAGLYPLFM